MGPLRKKPCSGWGRVFVSSAATSTQPKPRSNLFSLLSGRIPAKLEERICAALNTAKAKGENTESPAVGLIKIVFLPGVVSTVRFSLMWKTFDLP